MIWSEREPDDSIQPIRIIKKDVLKRRFLQSRLQKSLNKVLLRSSKPIFVNFSSRT
jgi:hypothetical protein